MPDLILYAANFGTFIDDLGQASPSAVFAGAMVIPAVPVKMSGDAGIVMVRVNDAEMFNGIASVQVLGTREEVFADPGKLAIYRQFYPGGSRQVQIFGATITVPDPEMPVFFQRD